MNILVLEDDPERQKVFRKELSRNYQLTIVDTVELAKSLVEEAEKNQDQFYVIFIDHDLGGEVFVDSKEENTGYQFALWLAENEIEAHFITHSLNPVGARNIRAVLPKCAYVPFTLLKSLLEKGLRL